ncbi:MAG TPA: hypothetical protein VGX51_05230 [Solirubrobacteraceae bacterium]|jgi:hypothetical protein|nr:hypothetical protein [Solirubrobacteraceae bacterium]
MADDSSNGHSAQLGTVRHVYTRTDAPRKRAGVRKRLAIVAGVVVFLAISALLARFLSVENDERDKDLAVLQAQARGDAAGMLAQLSGCSRSAACVTAVRGDAKSLRRPGAVKILSLKSSTAYALNGATGKTRVAWTVIGRLPVVQCIEVRRTGNPVSGIDVTLLSLSAPIENEADC